MKRRDPVEPLRVLQRERVDERAVELARQVERTRQADRRRAQVQRERQDAQARSEAQLRDERQRLERGLQRAADLESLARWATRVEADGETLASAEQAATDEAAQERHSEGELRARLADAATGARLLDERHDRWQRQVRAQRLRAEEEEATELVLARRARDRRGSE